MLFKNRLLLSSDETQFSNPLEASVWFRRQLRNSLLLANGVAVNVGSIADILGADDILADSAFIDLCNDFHSTYSANTPLIVIRGLKNKRIDLVQYFESRDDEWSISSLGGKPKGELTRQEYDQICYRLDALSRNLDAAGAVAEGVSQSADGRLSRHININIATRRIRGEQSISAPLSDGKLKLFVSHDELAAISDKAPSRSAIYVKLETLLRERLADRSFNGVEKDEVQFAKSYIAGKIKSEIIDRAYDSIFYNPDEGIVSGQFEFGDAEILSAIVKLRVVSHGLEQKINRALDMLSIPHQALNFAPFVLGRLRFILMLFSPQSVASALSELALEVILTHSAKPLASIAWAGFKHHYARNISLQQFSPIWDDRAVQEKLNDPKELASLAADFALVMNDFQVESD